jgi:uncharacterized phage infection (PIP) family protein YhgE
VVGGIGASVESLAGSVARVSSASETAGARLEGVATQLGTRLQKEMELVGTYSRAVGEMDAALGRARPTLDHLANAASKAHDAASRFQSVGESAVAIADRLTKTADTLKGELVVAATALEGAGSKLGGAAAATEAWSDKARSAIEKFGQETSRVIQDSLHLYDDSLTGAVRALKASMHEIEDLAEEIAGRRRGPQPTPPGPARPSSPSVTGSGLRR